MSDEPGLKAEPTTISPGLIGFYASCAAVGIGAAIGAVVLVVFPAAEFRTVGAVVGGMLVVGGSLGAWLSLRAARKER